MRTTAMMDTAVIFMGDPEPLQTGKAVILNAV